jgi:hypothetical protein
MLSSALLAEPKDVAAMINATLARRGHAWRLVHGD